MFLLILVTKNYLNNKAVLFDAILEKYNLEFRLSLKLSLKFNFILKTKIKQLQR